VQSSPRRTEKGENGGEGVPGGPRAVPGSLKMRNSLEGKGQTPDTALTKNTVKGAAALLNRSRGGNCGGRKSKKGFLKTSPMQNLKNERPFGKIGRRRQFHPREKRARGKNTTHRLPERKRAAVQKKRANLGEQKTFVGPKTRRPRNVRACRPPARAGANTSRGTVDKKAKNDRGGEQDFGSNKTTPVAKKAKPIRVGKSPGPTKGGGNL